MVASPTMVRSPGAVKPGHYQAAEWVFVPKP